MSKKRILIIDDDAELCEEIVDSLTGEGHLAESVQDPIKGVDLMRGGSYDIILLDYKMSLFSGADILKKLKADNIRKRIFIFSGSLSVKQALKEEDLLDMVSGIITKPIDFETLVQKITEA